MKKVIISLEEWKKKKDSPAEQPATLHTLDAFEELYCTEFTKLLKLAKESTRAPLGKRVNDAEFKKHLEGKINDSLLDKKLIEPSFFLCAMYVAGLLTETISKAPESWYAFDFFQKVHDSGNPHTYREGGDMCFLLTAIFPERGNRRLTDLQYYKSMGAMFYLGLYHTAGVEIGYHMSTCFNTMAEVTHECLDALA